MAETNREDQELPEPLEIDGRVLEYNEKAISDHLKLFSNFMSRGHLIEQLNHPHVRDMFGRTSFMKGQRITVDMTVEDSMLSHLFMAAMYGTSEVDGKPLLFGGCTINQISFKGATVFSYHELSTIRAATDMLNSKLFPNGEQGQ
jgi:hypothetical protein